MSDGDTPRLLYLVLLIVLVASSLVGMRLPMAKVAKMALGWVAIFGIFFMLFSFRGEFSSLGERLRAEATGAPIEQGGEIRIPMAEDGHFWVDGEINEQTARFLVDSGASVTTISAELAREAGIEGQQAGMISTANGPARVERGRAEKLAVGSIDRPGLTVLINSNDDTNVLGMNFLSSLNGWRVERNYLVLNP